MLWVYVASFRREGYWVWRESRPNRDLYVGDILLVYYFVSFVEQKKGLSFVEWIFDIWLSLILFVV